MANGDVDVTEGAGLKVGTYTISEDAVTRHLQRVALNNSAGTGLATDEGVNGTDVLRVSLATDSPGVLTEGQIDKANSVPVTMATDQEAVGYLARAHGTAITAVTGNTVVTLAANRHGIPFFVGGHPFTVCKSVRIASATSNLSLITVATGMKAVLTQIWVRADKANSGNTSVQIGFGNAATPTPDPAPVTGLVIDEDLGAGDGHQIGNGAAIIAVGTDFQDLFLTTENPTGGAITVGYSYHNVES